MKRRSTLLAVEALEDRTVPSTVVFEDFNKDGLKDMAALSGQKTITISLANPNGGYTVASSFTAPKPVDQLFLYDLNGDGTLDLGAGSSKSGNTYNFFWLSNKDGTFTYVQPYKFKPPHWGFF